MMMNIIELSYSAWDYLHKNGWVPFTIDVCLILLLTLIAVLLLRSICGKVKKRLSNRQVVINWYLIILQSIERPVYHCIWLYSIALVLEMTLSQWHAFSAGIIYKGKLIIITAALAAAALKAVYNIEQMVARNRKKKHDNASHIALDITSKSANAVIYIVAALIIMQALGISIDGILSFGGIGGIILGFASQGLLSNFFGTIMLYLDKPFTIGEIIKIEGKFNDGIVEKIDWRMTHIRTEERKLVFVPNSTFTTTPIENISRISHKLFQEKLLISYSNTDNIQKLLNHLQDMLQNNEEIDSEQEVSVSISSIFQDILCIKIKCYANYINNADFQIFRNILLIKIVNDITLCGLSLARAPKEIGLS